MEPRHSTVHINFVVGLMGLLLFFSCFILSIPHVNFLYPLFFTFIKYFNTMCFSLHTFVTKSPQFLAGKTQLLPSQFIPILIGVIFLTRGRKVSHMRSLIMNFMRYRSSGRILGLRNCILHVSSPARRFLQGGGSVSFHQPLQWFNQSFCKQKDQP